MSLAAAAAASGFIVFLLSVQVIQGQNVWGVTYTSTKICAVKGSTVEIHCRYTYPSRINGHQITVKKTFWFTKIYPYDPVDLTTDPQYSGRVQYHCANNYCTLRITDLRKSDSAVYKFRFTTNPLNGYTGESGVTLSVTGLQVSRSNNGLKCQSSCVPDRYSFIWYKNGQKIQTEAPSYYYLKNYNYEDSYSCAVKGYEDSPSPPTCADGKTCNRVTYTDRNICASKGSSVDISCTYSSYKNHVESKFWFSPERKGQWQNPSQPADLCKDSQFAGRVQVIDTERGRSTLRISDLRESDSAEYRFKFTAPSFEWGSSLPGTTLTVTALQVQVTRITVRQSVTEAELKCHSSCSPAGRLSYVWLKNKVEILWENTSSYKAQFGLSDNVSCAIRGHEQFPSPSVYAPKLPSVSVSPSAEIVEGRSVTLTCSSDANPAANYTWYKEDEDSPKASGQIFTITDFRAEHSGNYYCEAQNTRGRQISTLHLTVVTGAWKLAAAGTVSCVLLAILAVLAVFLWIRRKKSLTQEFHGGERPDNGPQLNMGPVYDAPSAAAQRQPAEGQDELHYSSISFPQNQEEALYSNVRPAQPHRQREEADDDDYVEYTAIKTESASGASGTRRQKDGEDLFALYSTVKK